MDTKWLRNSFIYLLILVAAIALFISVVPSGGGGSNEVSIGEVVTLAKQERIKKITVESDMATVTRNDSTQTVRARLGANTDIYDLFKNAGVPQAAVDKIEVEYRRPADLGSVLSVLMTFLPFLFLAGFLFFRLRAATTRRCPSARAERACSWATSRP
jgi:cell division protease FtsH